MWKKFKNEKPIEVIISIFLFNFQKPTKENYNSLRSDIEKLRDIKYK